MAALILDKDVSIHDEYDTSEDENITEIKTYKHFGEKINETDINFWCAIKS